jgi:hypothetical protein
MATKKKAAKKAGAKKAGAKKKAGASSKLSFNPKWAVDPVPWAWIRNLDTLAQKQLEQLRREVAARLNKIAGR